MHLGNTIMSILFLTIHSVIYSFNLYFIVPSLYYKLCYTLEYRSEEEHGTWLQGAYTYGGIHELNKQLFKL